MPPTELLPKPLAEAATAYRLASVRFDKARTDATAFEQVELHRARQKDIQALADAEEAGKKPPAPKAEAEAKEQLDGLNREVLVAETLEDRARIKLEDALANLAPKIVEQADQQAEKARAKVAAIINELEAEISELATAEALTVWAHDTSKAFEVPAVRVPVPAHPDEAPSADLVVAGLRGAVAPAKPVSGPVAEVEPARFKCPHCGGPHPLVDCTGDPEAETKLPPSVVVN